MILLFQGKNSKRPLYIEIAGNDERKAVQFSNGEELWYSEIVVSLRENEEIFSSHESEWAMRRAKCIKVGFRAANLRSLVWQRLWKQTIDLPFRDRPRFVRNPHYFGSRDILYGGATHLTARRLLVWRHLSYTRLSMLFLTPSTKIIVRPLSFFMKICSTNAIAFSP